LFIVTILFLRLVGTYVLVLAVVERE